MALVQKKVLAVVVAVAAVVDVRVTLQNVTAVNIKNVGEYLVTSKKAFSKGFFCCIICVGRSQRSVRMKINKKMLWISLLILLLEVIIALFVKDQIVRPYLGDILVVILIYTTIRIFDQGRIKGLPLYILIFAVLIEISQLLDLATLLGLSNNRIAVVLLGSTFDYIDILCYAIGAGLMMIHEISSVRREAIERRKRQARRSRRRRTSEENIRLAGMVTKSVLTGLIIVGLISALVVYVLNLYVIRKYDQNIVSIEEASDIEPQCILVLGAGVWSNDQPSPMLNDRLLQGIELYDNGVADRILMSGDHGQVGYDEVNVMKAFAVEAGVEPDHVFMDHAGFSTYESMVRAKEVFEVDSMIIVTQEYHLYRALYIANELGIEAYGVHADLRTYGGQRDRDIREIAARVKDYFYILAEPEPTYLGDVIPIGGSGQLTDDETD